MCIDDKRKKLVSYIYNNLDDDSINRFYDAIVKGKFKCNIDKSLSDYLNEKFDFDSFVNELNKLWNDRDVLLNYDFTLSISEEDNKISINVFLVDKDRDNVPYSLTQTIVIDNVNKSYNASFSSLSLNGEDRNDMEYFDKVDTLLSEVEHIFGELSVHILNIFY